MNKIYLKPETIEVKVDAQPMMQNTSLTKNTNPDDVVDNNDDVLSKGFSFFGEEELDEE